MSSHPLVPAGVLTGDLFYDWHGAVLAAHEGCAGVSGGGDGGLDPWQNEGEFRGCGDALYF
jgi:hypothetical protein